MRVLVCTGVCVLAATLGPATASAQSAADTRAVEGGVKAGIVSTTLSVTGLPGLEPNAGVSGQIGGWLSAGRDILRVQAEVSFSLRRFSLASSAGDIDVSTRMVELPVLLVGRFRPGARVRPLAFGGAYAGFLSNVSQRSGSTKTDIDDQIEDVDSGVIAGGGLQVAVGNHAIVIDAR